MLSDADRRRLAEIERNLQEQDPSFARRLSDTTPRSPAQWCGMGAFGWLAASGCAACLAVLLRSGGMTVIALLALCLSMGLWAADDDSRRSRR